MLRFVAVSLLVAAVAFAAPGDSPLPESLQQAKRQREEAIAQADQAYEQALRRELLRARNAKDASLEKAIEAELSALSGEPEQTAADRVAGTRWRLRSDPSVWVEFRRDGTFQTFAPGDTGLWSDTGDGRINTLNGTDLQARLHAFRVDRDGRRAVSTKPGVGDREWERVK